MGKGWTTADAARANAPKKRQYSAAVSTQAPKPTTELLKGIEAHHGVKTTIEQSAPAKLKPRYYVASFEGFVGGKLTIIDLPPDLLTAAKRALEGLGIPQAT